MIIEFLVPVPLIEGGYIMNYKKSAENILQALGGEDNVEAMTHCATRLRLVLKDEGLVDEKR